MLRGWTGPWQSDVRNEDRHCARDGCLERRTDDLQVNRIRVRSSPRRIEKNQRVIDWLDGEQTEWITCNETIVTGLRTSFRTFDDVQVRLHVVRRWIRIDQFETHQ